MQSVTLGHKGSTQQGEGVKISVTSFINGPLTFQLFNFSLGRLKTAGTRGRWRALTGRPATSPPPIKSIPTNPHPHPVRIEEHPLNPVRIPTRSPSRSARQMRRVAVKARPSPSLRPCHLLRARAHTKLGVVKIVEAGRKWLNRRSNPVLLPLEAWLCCNQQSILSYQT